MNCYLSSFEPNLKFVLDLKDDVLKTIYFEQHKRAEKALEEYCCSLKNSYLKYQKLLNENVEQYVTIKKLRKIIDNRESNQLDAIIALPSSEILGASPNCKVQMLSKCSLNDKKNNLFEKSSSMVQNENVTDFPPIYSEDFNSDVEDGNIVIHKTPPVSVVNSPEKVQNSPILSKRKKNCTKKSNSPVNSSSQSLESNNDSKVSSANASSFDKNIDIDYDLSKEFEKEYANEPLKPIENILQSSLQNNQNKNFSQKILNVSTTNYVKTEFLDKGKKSKQTTLSYKKVAPVIDISKVDFDENLRNQSMSILKQENWGETFYDSCSTSKNSNSILMNVQKLNSPISGKKETRTSNNQNTFAKEDECVEISFIQNERPSKLRSKLNLSKKSDVNDDKVKRSRLSEEKLPFAISSNTSKQKRSFKNRTPEKKYEKNINLEANESQRYISDETYFSQAETANHKNDVANFDVDSTEFEDDDGQCETPPAKKMLLSSFDIIPGRKEKSPKYAYKEGPVRKKSEKEKLPGWDCRDCEQYYKHLPEEERRKRQHLCSRHRGKYKPEVLTPDSFWNPVFSDTDDSPVFND